GRDRTPGVRPARPLDRAQEGGLHAVRDAGGRGARRIRPAPVPRAARPRGGAADRAPSASATAGGAARGGRQRVRGPPAGGGGRRRWRPGRARSRARARRSGPDRAARGPQRSVPVWERKEVQEVPHADRRRRGDRDMSERHPQSPARRASRRAGPALEVKAARRPSTGKRAPAQDPAAVEPVRATQPGGAEEAEAFTGGEKKRAPVRLRVAAKKPKAPGRARKPAPEPEPEAAAAGPGAALVIVESPA